MILFDIFLGPSGWKSPPRIYKYFPRNFRSTFFLGTGPIWAKYFYDPIQSICNSSTVYASACTVSTARNTVHTRTRICRVYTAPHSSSSATSALHRECGIVYSLKLIFPSYKQHTPSQLYKESITYCACIDLLICHQIYTSQSSASIITFESERDRMLAVLALSGRPEYTVKILD